MPYSRHHFQLVPEHSSQPISPCVHIILVVPDSASFPLDDSFDSFVEVGLELGSEIGYESVTLNCSDCTE